MIKKSEKLSITIITLFPEFVNAYAGSFGILKKAIKNKLLEIKTVNLRGFGLDERQTVDDRPYGGGVGMVLRADVLYKAISSSKKQVASSMGKTRTILLTPQGNKFSQKDAHRLAKYDQLIFVSGRYEGFDERIRQFADEELSIGDYVLMGGELPALVISEAVMRLRPGILGKIESTHNESFSENFLEYPQYTKPEVLNVSGSKGQVSRKKQLRVPRVLLSGNHQKINDWRMAEAAKRTKKRRPDLVKKSKIQISNVK